MKFNVKKVTSVTLLTSMMLTTALPPVMPVVAQETETEAVSEDMETEGMETKELENRGFGAFLKKAVAQASMSTEKPEETETDTPGSRETDEVPAEEQKETERETEDASEQGTEPAYEKKAEKDIEPASGEAPGKETDKKGSETEKVSDKTPDEAPDETSDKAPDKTPDKKPGNASEKNPDKNTEKVSETEAATETAKEIIPVTVVMNLDLMQAPESGSAPGEAGSAQKVTIFAENPSEDDADLRLYFWDYTGEEKNGHYIFRSMLTDVCEEVEILECKDTGAFPVVLCDAEGARTYEQASIHNEYDGDRVIARYLEISVLAGYSLEGSFQVTTETAETVVASPVVLPAELEPEVEYSKCVMEWHEKPEEVTVASEEVKENTAEEMEDSEIDEADMEITAGITEEVTENAFEDTPAEPENSAEDSAVSETVSDTSQAEADRERDTAETDAFMEALLGRLNAKDFASKRLIVLLSDEKKLREKDKITSNYDDLYLIDYKSIEECMAAYAYYADVAEAVEPDAFMEIASDGSEEALSGQGGASILPDGKVRVIALLDTGASASANVIERVS
ncbi:MAG: hypothetical protein HUJ72_12830, partial [Blautia sp.]|nr:hypothetical protein [Blautia sp.]